MAKFGKYVHENITGIDNGTKMAEPLLGLSRTVCIFKRKLRGDGAEGIRGKKDIEVRLSFCLYTDPRVQSHSNLAAQKLLPYHEQTNFCLK